MGENIKDRICIPLAERELNEVDGLKARIDQIQNACDHIFRLIKTPELKETLVSGVFVGLTRGQTKVGCSENQFEVVCIKCSQKRINYITSTCPRCLGHVKVTNRCKGANSREEYFGVDYLYFGIQLATCENCHFTVASDEWDQ